MARLKKFNVTLRGLIISAGFLEGVWLAIGINPERIFMDALRHFLLGLWGNPLYVFVLSIVPLALFLLTLYLIYKKGGLLGFAAVWMAFLGGSLVLNAPEFALAFFLIGLGIGTLATSNKDIFLRHRH